MADVPRHTQLYANLSQPQQDSLGKAVIEKLRELLGGYGELSVLAEYIAVMLQSNRPSDMIQTELEAFLQDQSRPFTKWLCKEIEKLSRQSGSEAPAQEDAGSEVLLNRVVREARKSGSGVKIEKTTKEGKERKSRKEERTSRRTETAPSAEVAQTTTTSRRGTEERRSRSRRRRRKAAEEATRTGGKSAAQAEADKKVVLTPNVQFLRDAYHQKGGEPEASNPEQFDPSKWHFRAEPPTALSAAPPGAMTSDRTPPPEYAQGPPPHMAHYGAPPQQAAPTRAAYPPGGPTPVGQTRPLKSIAPKKWKVVRPNTIVKATEYLQSEEVRTLTEGEIVEQVAPSFTLPGGIVRILIRHPSTPQFPQPIGWVTLDATAAGGPKFLEPGPEPMSRGKPWMPPEGSVAASQVRPVAGAVAEVTPRAPWAMSSPSRPARPPAPAPAATRGPKGFQNLVWTPSAN